MANALFEKGREGFLDGTLDWDTNAFKGAFIDTGTADVGIKAITAATNATPIVITATSHGFANGDIVVVGGVGGNLSANGVWKIANVATNTFELTDPITFTNVVGSAAYTSGGYAVCLGISAAGDNLDDFDAARVGTDQTLAGPAVIGGVADANDLLFPAVTGASIEAVLIYKDTGTASTSRCVAWMDGRHIVTCAAQAASTSTSIAVERLIGGILSGTVLTFSNGASATLTALANPGDRTIAVSSTAATITAGARADCVAAGTGLPVTPSGGSLSVAFDNGVNKIFKL